ncbi:MAG: LuxR C-terminal-related transcriptional regulator [Dehalococcoidia bacterium]
MSDERPLTDDALRDLRQLVAKANNPESTLAPSEAMTIADTLGTGAGLTIDLRATAEIGAPVVVLRLKADQDERVIDGLTVRETEVATLVAAGLRNRDIAAQLGISQATVKDHVHHILTKSGLSSRAAIAAALGNGRAQGRSATIHPSMDTKPVQAKRRSNR